MTRAMKDRLAKNRASALLGLRETGTHQGTAKPVHRPIMASRNLGAKSGFNPVRCS